MEVSQKPIQNGSVASKVSALAGRYPLDRYVWIMPKLDTAGALPEHLDFMMKTRKFSANDKEGDVYPVKGGGLALSKRSLMALAADAGIKWIPGMNRRIDDGSDPDIVEWQATGILAGLSGMTPVTATKHVDLELLRERDRANPKNTEEKLKSNDLHRREFKIEMAETKAQLRVIRAILGINSSFPVHTIQNKEFAVLQVIFAPNAKTPEERKMILASMMQTYLGAYPGAETAQLGGGAEAPIQIQPGQVQGSLPEAKAEPVDNYPASREEPIQEAEVEDEKPKTTDNFEFLKSMRELKNKLPETTYYTVLHDAGYQKSNLIIEHEEQGKVYRAMLAKVELLEKDKNEQGAAASVVEEAGNAGGEPVAPVEDQKEEELPYQFLLDARRKAFSKMSIQKLQAEIDSLSDGYDFKEDPLKLKGIEKKEDLIDAAVRLVEESIIRAAVLKQYKRGRS